MNVLVIRVMAGSGRRTGPTECGVGLVEEVGEVVLHRDVMKGEGRGSGLEETGRANPAKRVDLPGLAAN